MRLKIKKGKKAESNEGTAILDSMAQKGLSKKMVLEQKTEFSEGQTIDVCGARELQVE